MWVISTDRGDVQFKDRKEVRQWLRRGLLRVDTKAWNSLYNEWTTVAAIVRGESPDDWESTETLHTSVPRTPQPSRRLPLPNTAENLPRPQTFGGEIPPYRPRPVPEQGEKTAFFFHPIIVLFALVSVTPLGLLLLWIRPQKDFLGHPLARVVLTLLFFVPLMKFCMDAV